MRVVHPSVYLKQQERKRKKRRGKYSIPVLLLALLASYGYLAMNVQPVYSVARTYPHTIPAEEVAIQWPVVGSATIGYSGADGRIIASDAGQAQVPAASTIKILTALVVLERKPLGPGEDGERIYFNSTDVEMTNRIIAEGGAYYPITNGMSMSYHQALELLLVGSANNVSEKLAVWAFGGVKEYSEAASLYLKANGMLSTVASEPSGLSAQTTSTTDDMAKIALKAMELPVLREIARMEKTTVNGITVPSTNRLLNGGKAPYDGLKTGYLPEAGYCLVLTRTGTFNSQDYTFVAVVFGQSSREASFAEASRLVDQLYDGTKSQQIIDQFTTVADIVAPWGEETKAISRSELSGYRWPGESASVKVEISPTKFVPKHTNIGTVSYRDRRVDVMVSADLPQPSLWWRMTHALDHLEEIL